MAIDVTEAEQVGAADIGAGDVVTDDLGWRWLTVRQIRTIRSVVSFYGDGPGDRMTFDVTERVRRRLRAMSEE